MKRVIVIGSPGAGKSTFARKLKDKTGLPLYYLDRIFHKPDRTTVTREEFDQKLQTILQTDSGADSVPKIPETCICSASSGF